MSEDIRRELNAVSKELAQVESQISELLEKQQRLQLRQAELKNRLHEESSAKLASLNWERDDFSWSKKLYEIMENTFKIQQLRPLQLSAMNATLSNEDCILIMPTGGGKSLCYQLPALISQGITLVISPLVSLMEDQLMALTELEVPAAMLNASCSRDEANRIQTQMLDKKASLKILYVTPEKLSKSKRFMAKLEKMYTMGRFSRLAIDEVHCCSQWGHDFRPDYKFLGIMKKQFPEVPILGLTATATSRVIADVKKILNIPGCLVLKASFNRPNLKYEVHSKSPSFKENVDDLCQLIKQRFPGQSGIIYCFSIKESQDVANELQKQRLRVSCYHAQLDAKERSMTHRRWMNNEIQIIVATVAFGMGIDKPNVRFVIHYSLPKSMENFYQESGRAGRDGQPAYCILFYRLADVFRQSTMVFVEPTGLENLYNMVAYCLDLSKCRRALISQYFNEAWKDVDCKQMCDHCDPKNKISGKPTDLTEQCLAIYKLITHASERDERLTGQKIIDAWQGKGSSSARQAGVKPTTKSREFCERIIGLLLVEGYLKEDFHFTPYSNISYLSLGPKSKSVLSGQNKVVLEMYATKQPTGKGSTSKSVSAVPSPPSSSPSPSPPLPSSDTQQSTNQVKKRKLTADAGTDPLSIDMDFSDFRDNIGKGKKATTKRKKAPSMPADSDSIETVVIDG